MHTCNGSDWGGQRQEGRKAVQVASVAQTQESGSNSED